MQDSIPRGVIEVGIRFAPPPGNYLTIYFTSILHTLPAAGKQMFVN